MQLSFTNSIIKKILRRPFFRGQDRLFNFFFKNKMLQTGHIIGAPLNGNFKIKCDTNTWIGSRIIYLGDYEPILKKHFKTHINLGDTVLDIGANIGLHTLYFAELAGNNGKVIAFEPVLSNFNNLKANIALNPFKNIQTENIALGHKNEIIKIAADESSTNPGSFNLFDREGENEIICKIGDEVLNNEKIDFIKIDVEGYEGYVIDGLFETIKKNKPKIVFEYDPNYQFKTGLPNDYIFKKLLPLKYSFKLIHHRQITDITNVENVLDGDILALPNA